MRIHEQLKMMPEGTTSARCQPYRYVSYFPTTTCNKSRRAQFFTPRNLHWDCVRYVLDGKMWRPCSRVSRLHDNQVQPMDWCGFWDEFKSKTILGHSTSPLQAPLSNSQSILRILWVLCDALYHYLSASLSSFAAGLTRFWHFAQPWLRCIIFKFSLGRDSLFVPNRLSQVTTL